MTTDKQNPVDQAYTAFQTLMRNYPLWPSTFSTCKCERGFGRGGGGPCALCAREALAEIVGNELTWQADEALEEVMRVWQAIRDKMSDQ